MYINSRRRCTKIITEEKFYTCRNDRAFKEILLNSKNEEILKNILEMVLEVKIKEIQIENNEQNSGNIKVRRKNLDILLHTDKGKIDIEMNACRKKYLHTRNMAYQCDNYAHYTLVGEEYTEDVQIIQINFTYEMSKKEKNIVRKYYIQDEEQNKFVKNFRIIEYNMDKIMEFWYAKKEKEIEKYKYLIMLDLGLEDLEKLSKKDRWVKEYKMDIEIINRDVRFREYMSEEEDRRKCYNSDIRIAKEEGLNEGIKEANRQTAEKMLQLPNITFEQISECTNLSKEEIEKLKNTMN